MGLPPEDDGNFANPPSRIAGEVFRRGRVNHWKFFAFADNLNLAEFSQQIFDFIANRRFVVDNHGRQFHALTQLSNGMRMTARVPSLILLVRDSPYFSP